MMLKTKLIASSLAFALSGATGVVSAESVPKAGADMDKPESYVLEIPKARNAVSPSYHDSDDIEAQIFAVDIASQKLFNEIDVLTQMKGGHGYPPYVLKTTTERISNSLASWSAYLMGDLEKGIFGRYNGLDIELSSHVNELGASHQELQTEGMTQLGARIDDVQDQLNNIISDKNQVQHAFINFKQLPREFEFNGVQGLQSGTDEHPLLQYMACYPTEVPDYLAAHTTMNQVMCVFNITMAASHQAYVVYRGYYPKNQISAGTKVTVVDNGAIFAKTNKWLRMNGMEKPERLQLYKLLGNPTTYKANPLPVRGLSTRTTSEHVTSSYTASEGNTSVVLPKQEFSKFKHGQGINSHTQGSSNSGNAGRDNVSIKVGSGTGSVDLTVE
jgi:hypothetical protein